MENFTPIPNMIFAELPDAVLLYAHIANHANHGNEPRTVSVKVRKVYREFTLQKGQAVIGQRKLADLCGLKSVKKLRQLIKDLETYGYLTAETDDGCTKFTVAFEADLETMKEAKKRKAERKTETQSGNAIDAVHGNAIEQANKPFAEISGNAKGEANGNAILPQYIDSIDNQKDLLELPVDKSPERVEVIHTEEAGAELSTSDRATTEEEPPQRRDLTVFELLEEETRELTPVEKYLIRSRADRAIRENREVDREIIRELARVIKSSRP